MKRIFLILMIAVLFVLSMSLVSAKEDAHFEVEKDSSGFSAIVTLKDSSGNPIPGQKFKINITKPNGSLRQLPVKTLNKTGQNIFYLGSVNGNYVVSLFFKGNEQYNPCWTAKTVYVSASRGGNSMDSYYDSHDYGDSVVMDDYMDYSFWDEEIYDNPYNYDGEWY